MTRTLRAGLNDEVSFRNPSPDKFRLVINTHVSISTRARGLKQNAALLEIAMALNARSDFREVCSLVLERAITLVWQTIQPSECSIRKADDRSGCLLELRRTHHRMACRA